MSVIRKKASELKEGDRILGGRDFNPGFRVSNVDIEEGSTSAVIYGTYPPLLADIMGGRHAKAVVHISTDIRVV